MTYVTGQSDQVGSLIPPENALSLKCHSDRGRASEWKNLLFSRATFAVLRPLSGSAGLDAGASGVTR